MASWGVGVPARVARPYVVVVSTVLLLVAVVARSVSVLLDEREYWAYGSAYNTLHPGTDGFAALVLVIRGVFLLFALGVVVVLAVLAVVNLFGKQVARVFTWVVGGLLVLGIAGRAVLDVAFSGEPGGESRELRRLAYLELPGWHDPVTLALDIAVPLLLLAALLLLALPAAGAFVRAKVTHDPRC